MIKICIDPKTPREQWADEFIRQWEESSVVPLTEEQKLIIRTVWSSPAKAYGKLTVRRVC